MNDFSEEKTPLYIRVKEYLLTKIKSHELQPGDAIPTEMSLADQFIVSRPTVRQAITELVFEGYLVRHQGKGTFVSKPKIETNASKMYTFAQGMMEKGIHPKSKVLQFDIVLPNRDIEEQLALEHGELVIKVVRLRFAGDEPMMIETTYLPRYHFAELTADELETKPLYSVIESRFGIRIEKALESLEPVLMDDFNAKLLDVPKGSPAMFVERRAFSDEKVPIELSRAIVRGDRSKYLIELTR